MWPEFWHKPYEIRKIKRLKMGKPEMELERVPFFFCTHSAYPLYSRKKVMIRSYLIFAFTLLMVLSVRAQDRYQGDWFDEINVETYTYATKDGENLDLDVYLPQGDNETERATIIYVHGGGFSGGSRDRNDVKEFCTKMANYGYVVASVSYRLTRKGEPTGFGCNCPATDKLNTFNAAVEDVQDATFFLIENRHQFAINPQKIILAGSSAGAETVLNAAYQPPYCYGLDSGPVSFAGVISMAGAIPDTTVIYDESVVPSLLFHGTDDNLVPYGTAPHHYCEKGSPGYLILHGSYTIAEKLEQLNVPYWLHTTCGGAHEIASTPMKEYLDVIVDFCYAYIVRDEGDDRRTIIEGKQNTEKYVPYNFCAE
jgi:predicted esterase